MSITFASEDLETRLAMGGLGFARFGEALHREKRTADALRVLGEGTRRHPEYTPGLLILGRLYFETGGLLEAKAELEKILTVESRCPAALKLLAQIAEGLRAYGESARLYSQLAALEPWDAEFGESHRRALELSGGGTLSAATQEAAGFIEVDLNEVGNFLPQDNDPASSFEMGSATVAVEPPRVTEPRPEAANIYSPPAEGPAALADTAVVDKERVEGADIEKRLDDLFSTETATVETMAPGKAGTTPAEPMVTGDDIEDQLDKLFSTAGDTVHQPRETDHSPAKPNIPAPSPEATFFPGMDERTISMPSFTSLTESLPKAAPFEPQAPPQAPEEVIESVDMRSVTETGVFESAEVHGTSDQVMGEDIGNRLDELFGSESAPARSASLDDGDDPGTSETLAYLAPARETTFTEKNSAAAVSGNDIEDRLSEMFDLEPAPKTDEPKAPAQPSFHDEAAQTLGFSRTDVFKEENQAEPLDEDSFPDAAPNVATVTLAEIYFDQGLKEQALQIYRQLLEREPDNESVKKRLEEIEASKSAEARGNGSSGEGGPPPPRPGLKVPRRKK